ncbi:unnamed protein product, partial [Rotaria sp. Silwood2]
MASKIGTLHVINAYRPYDSRTIGILQ